MGLNEDIIHPISNKANMCFSFLDNSIVSPDGLLQQSSTVADSALFTFADGITETIPRSYIEFAERLLLPQFKDLQAEEVSMICSFYTRLHNQNIWHIAVQMFFEAECYIIIS